MQTCFMFRCVDNIVNLIWVLPLAYNSWKGSSWTRSSWIRRDQDLSTNDIYHYLLGDVIWFVNCIKWFTRSKFDLDTKKIGKGNSFLHVAISGDQPINQDGIESMNRRVRSLAHKVPFEGPVGMGVWKNAQEDGSWMKLMEMELFHIKTFAFCHSNKLHPIFYNILKCTGEYTATKPNMELKRAETSSAWKEEKRSLFLAPLG